MGWICVPDCNNCWYKKQIKRIADNQEKIIAHPVFSVKDGKIIVCDLVEKGVDE